MPYPCCCKKGCPLFSDDFNRADGPTVGNGWTVASGTWSISNNVLAVASGSASLNSPWLGATVSQDVRVKVKGGAAGDILGLSASGGGAVAQLEFASGTGNGYVRYIRGVTQTLSITCEPGVWYELRVTSQRRYTTGIQFVYDVVVWLDGVPVLAANDTGNNWMQVRLAANTSTGAEFDDFEVLNLDDGQDNEHGCPNYNNPCAGCPGIKTPGTWKVTIHGIEDRSGGGGCSNCEVLNGDYYFNPTSPGSTGTMCLDSYNIDNPCNSSIADIEANYFMETTTWTLLVHMRLDPFLFGSCSYVANFTKAVGDRVDCKSSTVHKLTTSARDLGGECCKHAASAYAEWEFIGW